MDAQIKCGGLWRALLGAVNIKILCPLLLAGLAVHPFTGAAQSSPHHYKISDFLMLSADSPVTNKHPQHKALETELEIYPFNIGHPSDPAIKNEVMLDYHLYSDDERYMGGIRFFTLVNTHYKHDRDMRDLLMYTEAYYGLDHFQLGAEIGSITGVEYFSVGPQFTMYDNVVFKRVSLISRVMPDIVVGYEFTTQELHLSKHFGISATGMSRFVLPSDEKIFQISAWVSIQKIHGLAVGVEYEYNNASFFNNHAYERSQEIFLGIRIELH